jgi:hypothetical protein
LNALEGWLWQGPPSARVDDVARSDIGDEVTDGFTVS